MSQTLSLVKRVSRVPLYFMTALCGELVGQDNRGNRYYHSRLTGGQEEGKRWVVYAGDEEPTQIPPSWYRWMHKMQDRPLPQEGRKSYQGGISLRPNPTGTNAAILPEAFVPSCFCDDQPDPIALRRFWRPF